MVSERKDLKVVANRDMNIICEADAFKSFKPDGTANYWIIVQLTCKNQYLYDSTFLSFSYEQKKNKEFKVLDKFTKLSPQKKKNQRNAILDFITK